MKCPIFQCYFTWTKKIVCRKWWSIVQIRCYHLIITLPYFYAQFLTKYIDKNGCNSEANSLHFLKFQKHYLIFERVISILLNWRKRWNHFENTENVDKLYKRCNMLANAIYWWKKNWTKIKTFLYKHEYLNLPTDGALYLSNVLQTNLEVFSYYIYISKLWYFF